jgi:hypothetical protein
MPKVCSIEASKLSPTDAAAYKSRRKHSTQLAFVETRLPIAKRELAMVVAEAHSAHPDLIDKNGDFFEDLLAKQFEEDARQASAFNPLSGRATRSEVRSGPFNERSMTSDPEKTTTAEVRADLTRRSVADPRVVEADDAAASQKAAAEKINAAAKAKREAKAAKDAEAEREAKAAEARAAEAERKAKEEAGRKKSGAERLARKKQPGGAGKAGAGTTTKPASGQGAANLKAKGKGGTADTSNQKKSTSETVQSEPTGTEQPQPAVGKEQQPTSVSGVKQEAAAFIVTLLSRVCRGQSPIISHGVSLMRTVSPMIRTPRPEDILAALKAKQEAATTATPAAKPTATPKPKGYDMNLKARTGWPMPRGSLRGRLVGLRSGTLRKARRSSCVMLSSTVGSRLAKRTNG